MNLEEKLYTSTEVAQILGVSLRSVYRYLEEGKLDAEVKTATGRHRFTKQNILDFLYPNKDSAVKATQKDTSNVQETRVFSQKKVEQVSKPVEAPAPVTQELDDELETEEEPVDWLAKFREAANKFKTQDEEASESIQSAPQSQPQPASEISDQDTLTDLGDFSFISNKEPEVQPDSTRVYYRSMLGGLKDIAQNIDKSARKASVDYAFTLNAGLSLHKPIKPFSILHAYVKPQDKELFEKMLQLVPAEKDTAQVCLILSNRSSVYENKKELHGLYVVSNMQLKADLMEAGEEDLASDLDQDFPF